MEQAPVLQSRCQAAVLGGVLGLQPGKEQGCL